MNKTVFKLMTLNVALVACFGLPKAHAMINGLSGTTTFNLTAKVGNISTADGDAHLNWGYANDTGAMQYPGPTLIVNQGETIDVYLRNELTVKSPDSPPNVSIVFPGQIVTATGGSAGLLTQEAAPGGADIVHYQFTASQPGTYMYHSGTNPELQIEMGLVGAIIVRPTGYVAGDSTTWRAYEHADSAYNLEFLFLETEMDPLIHRAVERGRPPIDMTTWFPVYWFINGRNAPDTMLAAGVPWLPFQPYNCMPRMHPGDRMLLRIVAAGRDPHPFHTHGNNGDVIARDGRLLQSASGAGADLKVSDYTFVLPPSGTADVIFQWTGEKLGWDIYGHATTDPMQPNEYAPDHGKPFPVTMPGLQELTFGSLWSGSPFLGTMGTLPPGEGGLNVNGGLAYMWHSHNEKELTNNDIFPGGLMTMLIIEPPGIPID